MEITNAVNFLVGSVLFSVSIIVIGLAVVVLNNVFSKYWKPIRWQVFETQDLTVVDHQIIEEIKTSLAKQKSQDPESKKKNG